MAKQRFVYGFHGIASLLRHRADDVIRIYYDRQRQDARMQHVLQQIDDMKLPVSCVEGARLAQMVDARQHQGIVAEVKERQQGSLPDFLQTLDMAANPVVMLLDSVTDPHNLGACFRIADAFGVSAIIVPKDRSAPLNATVSKTASGATETVPFFAVTNLVRTIELLKKTGFWIFGTEMADTAKAVNQLDLQCAVAWVFGSEGAGIRNLTRQHCDHLAIVPMTGEVESLNISVAAGVCLYETQRQRGFSVQSPQTGLSAD